MQPARQRGSRSARLNDLMSAFAYVSSFGPKRNASRPQVIDEGCGEKMSVRAVVGVRSANRRCEHSGAIGATIEGRVAWPRFTSPLGHLCKPPRPTERLRRHFFATPRGDQFS